MTFLTYLFWWDFINNNFVYADKILLSQPIWSLSCFFSIQSNINFIKNRVSSTLLSVKKNSNTKSYTDNQETGIHHPHQMAFQLIIVILLRKPIFTIIRFTISSSLVVFSH